MKKLKFRGKEENGKKPQNGAKKREFSNTNRLIAGIMTVATAFGIAGCSERSAVGNSNNHNDGSVDVNEIMDASIDAFLQDSRPDVNNPIDAEVDANHPDSSVDANHPDSSVDANHPDSSVDANTPDATIDSSVEDASIPDSGNVDAEVDSSSPDAGIVCVSENCEQPFTEVRFESIPIGQAVEVGEIWVRYTELLQMLSPTRVTVDLECNCTVDSTTLRQGVELIETQEHTEDLIDYPTAGQSWRIRMTLGTADANQAPIGIIVEPI